MYVIKVDGEEIDHADTRAEARRARDTIIYGEIGTEENTTIEPMRWEVTYILDSDQEVMVVQASNEHAARHAAQKNFGSPIEIMRLRKL
jgi:nucleoside-triphosphatase THEP1